MISLHHLYRIYLFLKSPLLIYSLRLPEPTFLILFVNQSQLIKTPIRSHDFLLQDPSTDTFKGVSPNSLVNEKQWSRFLDESCHPPFPMISLRRLQGRIHFQSPLFPMISPHQSSRDVRVHFQNSLFSSLSEVCNIHISSISPLQWLVHHENRSFVRNHPIPVESFRNERKYFFER